MAAARTVPILALIAFLSIPGAGLATPGAATEPTPIPPVAGVSAADRQSKIENFALVPWRDGRNRTRLAAVAIVRYPKLGRPPLANALIRDRLRLVIRNSQGAVLARARDVASVPIWRRGARPRAVHVLSLSALHSRRLLRQARRVRAWANPSYEKVVIDLTTRLDAEGSTVASTSDSWSWLPVFGPVIDSWNERYAHCRKRLPGDPLLWSVEQGADFVACLATGNLPPYREFPDGFPQTPLVGYFDTQCRAAYKQKYGQDLSTWALTAWPRQPGGRDSAELLVYNSNRNKMKRYVMRTWPLGADGLKLYYHWQGFFEVQTFEVRIDVDRRAVDPDCPLTRATNEY